MARRLKKVASAPASATDAANRTEEILREHMVAGRWKEAIRMAKGFAILGDEKAAITRAWEAYERPEFLRQIKRDPEAAIEEGKAALLRRYGRPETAGGVGGLLCGMVR